MFLDLAIETVSLFVQNYFLHEVHSTYTKQVKNLIPSERSPWKPMNVLSFAVVCYFRISSAISLNIFTPLLLHSS